MTEPPPRGHPPPAATPEGLADADADLQRAARERHRLVAEIDRLGALVTDRNDRLARAIADRDRLRSRPGLAAYLRLLNALARVRRWSRGNAPDGSAFHGGRPEPRAAGPSESLRRATQDRLLAGLGPAPESGARVGEVVTGGQDAGASLARIAADVTFDWVLLRDAGTVPAEPGWLDRLVAGAAASGADAACPRVLVEVGGTVRLAAAGMGFDPGPGMPRLVPLGRGADAFGTLAKRTEVVALPAAAAFIVRREVLAAILAVGSPSTRSGAEALALDLGLRIAAAEARVVHVGSAAVWTSVSEPAAVGPAGRNAGELEAVMDAWGPRLHRQVWRAARAGAGPWAVRRLRVHVAGGGTEPRAVAEALGRLGFETVAAPAEPVPAGSADIVLALDGAAPVDGIDPSAVRIARLGPDDRPAWRDHLDQCLDLQVDAAADAEAIAGQVAAAIDAWIERPKVAIHIGPADWAAARTWGDTEFGFALGRALRARGVATNLLVYAERDSDHARRADVALHVVGLRQLPVRPGQVNVLWIISHPDAVRAEVASRYDLVFVASDPFARALRAELGDDPPVIPLHQATDPERFHPAPGGPPHRLLFVGNSRNRHRPVLDELRASGEDLAVYGTNWRPELLDPRHLRGGWVDNAELHRFYAAAEIVLNDHWADMRDEGFIANRLYDVAASGGFALTDDVAGISEEFDGGIAVWRDPDELRAAAARYLADPGLRRRMADRARTTVLARHTFGHRADALVAAWSPRLDARPSAVTGGPPATRRAGT